MTGADSTLTDVFSKLAELQKVRPEDPEEACKQFWSVLRLIYVADPANAEKIHWGRCELPNERNAMKYWTEYIAPSIQSIHLTAEQLSSLKMPVLIIHGNRAYKLWLALLGVLIAASPVPTPAIGVA
ncbi:MAG: hypothetical protein LAP13_21810 [Acidobacteriia bacterium]|nr:hypothetical protein [Terriglobia bacterium]